jgi:hypothetical protein
LPGYIEKRVVAEAAARGIELDPGDVSFDWRGRWVQLSNADAKLIGAPGFEAKIGLVDVELESFEPTNVTLSKVDVGVSGSLPRVLLELGEWTQKNPRAYEAPVVASEVSVKIAEEPALPPWLELSHGMLTRTNAGAVFAAQSCKLSGFELGHVGAGYAKTGGDVSIGFGDQSAQAAPLRLDASIDAKGVAKLKVALTPTKLGLLGKGLGIPLPLPEVIAAGNVELALPADALLGKGEITGKLTSSLKGFVPPHPPELDGFVFGDLTTFDTDLSVDPKREHVKLLNSQVTAGKFALAGGGQVERQGQAANLSLDLKGNLPCDALAGAAAESRLGQLLGRVSGKQGKRTALAFVTGTVSVEVSVNASTKALNDAKVARKIGVGCGLRPLSLSELIALTPNAKDLQAIGSEVGTKLNNIGKDLGLPPLPTDLPPLPPLPNLLDDSPSGSSAGKSGKKLAAPAPSG